MNSADVLVVGGGPAGLAAAIALRQAGREVVVADGAGPVIDKACGEGLMPRALKSLRALGVDLPVDAGRPFRGISFCVPGAAARAPFAGACGVGMRRTELHGLLVEHAQAAGVVLRWNSPMQLEPDGTALIAGERWTAQWVIGADGRRSAIRRAAALEPRESVGVGSERFGFRQHFRAVPWSHDVEVYWTDGVQAYVTPVAEDQICVALVGEEKNCRLAALSCLFPELAARLAGATCLTSERGAMTSCRRIPRLARGNVLLIGDAAGSVDAVTGLGLSIALEQAVELGAALQAGRPEKYARRALALQRMPRTMSSVLTFLSRHPEICRRVIVASAREARVFARLTASHSGTRSALAWRAGTLARLGWHFARA